MSKKRSPREVCSMTDGMTRFDGCVMVRGSLAAGGPKFRLGLLLFLVGSPNRLARIRELARDPLHLAGDAIERIAQPDVVAQGLEAAALAQAQERVVDVVARFAGLLAHQRLDVLVGDLQPELLRDRLEHELARNRARRLLAEPGDELLRLLAGHREIRLERNAACLDLSRERAQQLARARLDERTRGIDLRGRDERVDDVRTEARLGLLGDL